MREEFSTLFPLCTHQLALSARPGAEAGEKLTLQEMLAYAGIHTPDLTSRRFRGYQLDQLDHRGDESQRVSLLHFSELGIIVRLVSTHNNFPGNKN
ncbi:unnamed protein product [Ectocarpus sp. CCAP 1310/34]|nr:unnamed protein product [Ectocarpus sp. CCAP 1310/34]